MIASLSFLLDYEKIEDDDDSDLSSSEDEMTPESQVVLSRESIYKVGFAFYGCIMYGFFIVTMFVLIDMLLADVIACGVDDGVRLFFLHI